MNDQTVATTPSPAGISKFAEGVSGLQVLIAAITAQIVPIFVWMGVSKPVALMLSLGIFGGAFLLWRWKQRHEAELAASDRRAEQAASRVLQAGFRGLASYTHRDTLPGRSRQNLARRIATSVAADSFRYGLVSGEIGAGKSSLLDSGVRRELQGEFCVCLIRGLQDFTSDRSLASVTAAWRDQWSGLEGNLVIILDQFEELLIEWSSADERLRLGRFIAAPVPDRNVRILCAVRSDYIIAMHDLAPGLADPTSARTLFPITNLDQEEAVDIILECARRDAIEIHEELARTIATDLSHGGRVRPPELQLVCQSLVSGSPERRYREAGGAEGILSDYIKNAADYSAAPELARLALRAMCNLQAMPPAKMPPQSAADIGRAIGLTPGDARFARLEQALQHLDHAGVITGVRHGDDQSFALIHDYLVQPVVLATADVTTQAERATQLLRLHLTEYATDPRSRIPFRRIGFIRKHADKDLVASAPARSLIGRSYRRSAAAGGLAGVAAAVVILIVAYSAALTPHWERTSVATQTLDGSPAGVRFSPVTDDRILGIGGGFSTFWNPRTGRLVSRVEGNDGEASKNGRVLMFKQAAKDDSERLLISKDGGKPAPTPFLVKFMDSEALDDQGRALIVATNTGKDAERIQVMRIADMKIIADRVLPVGFMRMHRLNRVGDAMVVLSTRGGTTAPVLWRFNPGPTGQVVDLVEPNAKFIAVALDAKNDVVAVLSKVSATQASLSLWSSNSGERLATRTFQTPQTEGSAKFMGEGRIILTESGPSFFFLSEKTKPEHPILFYVNGLVPVARVPAHLESAFDLDDNLAWSDQGTTTIWDVRNDKMVKSASLKLTDIKEVVASKDRKRMIIVRKTGEPELWDMEKWARLPIQSPGDRIVGLKFALGEPAVIAELRSGQYVILDINGRKTIGRLENIKNISLAYYDVGCGKLRLWTQEGLTVQYTRGRTLPWFGFRPAAHC